MRIPSQFSRAPVHVACAYVERAVSVRPYPYTYLPTDKLGEGALCKFGGCGRVITSHIFLALKYHKRVAAVGLALFVAFLICVRVFDNADLGSSEVVLEQRAGRKETHSLDRPVAGELALQVLLVGLVAQPRHDERLERVTADVWVVRGFN